MSDEAVTPARRRRKKLSREERTKKAERMRLYRAGKAPTDKSKTPAANDNTALAPGSTPTPTPAPVALAEPSAPQGLTIEQKEHMLSEALAGTVEVLADTAQLLWLDAKAPHLGRDRAKTLGALWAPILAPYINEDMARWLPLALACGGTANAFYQWVHEYRAFSDKREAKPLAVVREATA